MAHNVPAMPTHTMETGDVVICKVKLPNKQLKDS